MILDGVPPLLDGIATIFAKQAQAVTLARVLSEAFFLNSSTGWGIYKKGTTDIALEFDGFIDFSIQNESQVANYAIEKGQFAAYNKVDSPYAITLIGVKNGTDTELSAFLRALDVISNDIKLYDIVTPEQTFSNSNMLNYSIRRNSQEGFKALYVYMTFVQILSTLEATTKVSTKTIAGQPVESTGIVSPSKPS